METNIEKSSLRCGELILDTSLQQAIDCDALLPDYCPDMLRVLKCCVNPIISNTQVRGTSLDIEGLAEISVYYIGSVDGVYKADYKVPFTRNIELRKTCEECSVNTSSSVVYVNCRAVNQRRLDIRGAIEICVQCIAFNDEGIVTDASADALHLLKEKLSIYKPIPDIAVQIRTNENIEELYGKPPIKDILRSEAISKIIDSTAENGKIIIKGEISLYIFYRSEDGSYDRMEFSLPLNSIINSEYITADTKYTLFDKTLMCKCEPNGNTIEADIVTEIKCCMRSAFETDICKDCFSTKYKCDFEKNPIKTIVYEDTISKSILCRESIDAPEDIKNILDIRCEPAKINIDNGNLNLKFNICVLTVTNEDEIFYFEKTLEASEPLLAPSENVILTPAYKILSCDYNIISDRSIELRIEIEFKSTIYKENTIETISEIKLDTTSEPENPIKKGLYIYYPDKKENVWDIAKKYNTSPETIREENDEENPKIIIIPVN